MTMMLAPDLLDRRAAGLPALAAPGRPAGELADSASAKGVRVVAKSGGRIAVLAAPGLEAHSAAFESAPATPALRSRAIALDLTPTGGRLLPRRFVLKLPRNPDPAQKDNPLSLFQAE